MRRQLQIIDDEIEVDMTPMLDVVFIMLIFFIVTAVFVKDTGIDIIKPNAVTGVNIKRVSTLIGISEDNKIWINKHEVMLEDVREIVSKLKLENPKGKMVIKADTQSDAGLVILVVEVLNQIGVAGVSIATEEGGVE